MAKTMTELMELFPNNPTILDAVIKTEDHIARQAQQGGKIMVSVSGGSDSDIMLDMFERIGYPDGLVYYAWFDTGMEYQATKRHLMYLEQRYGITIHRHRPKLTVAQACKRYGVPFLGKRPAMAIGRLQQHGFDFGPICDNGHPSDVAWWHGDTRLSSAGIMGLKEFLMVSPPDFKISDKCCDYAKKNTAKAVAKQINATLNCNGMRKSEGGIRSIVLKSCFSEGKTGEADKFRPIFWFTDSDKAEYEKFCEIRHSDCYTEWGFKRTGCACCPFGSGFEEELEVVRREEPSLYNLANKVFGQSYEYTRRYRQFKEALKRERRRKRANQSIDNSYEIIKEDENNDLDKKLRMDG